MIANFAGDGRPAGLDGTPAAGHRGRHRATRRGRARVEVDRAAPTSKASSRCGPAGRRCSAAISNEDERYREVLRRRLVPDRRSRRRDARRLLTGSSGAPTTSSRSSGHLIGPFEVESALLEHPAVAEAGVIGKPDPVAGEIVKAFVALSPVIEPSEALRDELLGFARKRLGAAVAPKEIAFPSSTAAEPERQDHAPAAQGARAGAARRRHVDAGRSRHEPSTVDREHGTARMLLCHEMLRIRRFEEKCAELYSAGKIRGFLHLYIGEEAVAVGAMQALDAGRRSSRPTASTATRWRAASPPDASWRRCTARRRLQPRPRRLDAPVRCQRIASTAATPSSAAGCRSPSGSRSPTRCSTAARHRLLLRRRRGGRGRVSRVAESRRAVEAAGAVPLREQPLRHGHAPRARAVADRSRREGRGATRSRPNRGRHGRAGGRSGDATRPPTRSARRRARVSRVRTYRFRAHSMFDPELYRDKAEVEQWKQRDPIATLHRVAAGRPR